MEGLAESEGAAKLAVAAGLADTDGGAADVVGEGVALAPHAVTSSARATSGEERDRGDGTRIPAEPTRPRPAAPNAPLDIVVGRYIV